jgi:hypothetical protein
VTITRTPPGSAATTADVAGLVRSELTAAGIRRQRRDAASGTSAPIVASASCAAGR